MQSHFTALRSQASNINIQLRPLLKEMSLDSLNPLMRVCTVDDGIFKILQLQFDVGDHYS